MDRTRQDRQNGTGDGLTSGRRHVSRVVSHGFHSARSYHATARVRKSERCRGQKDTGEGSRKKRDTESGNVSSRKNKLELSWRHAHQLMEVLTAAVVAI